MHGTRSFSISFLAVAGILVLLSGCSSDEGRIASTDAAPESSEPGVATETVSAQGETSEVADRGFRPVRGFATDFSRSTIPESDVLSGGPPKDGIPAIDQPEFEPVTEASAWLVDDEPVFVVSAGDETRIYPVQILTYHEIVNDVVGDTPLSVTFCPLCNSGLTFRREFDGVVLDFGTTGRLRYSNLIMYDRQTETWWQQATGEGLVGRYAGDRLELYPMLMMPWDRAAELHPEATVLSRDTGYARPYGNNPYAGYDTSRQPFLYSGPRTPGPFTSMDRVVEVVNGNESIAVPYPVLAEELLVQRDVGGLSVVVFWSPGTASALDTAAISQGRDVGAANAFSAELNGRMLTFQVDGSEIVDVETGTSWDAFGRALAGELAGARLSPVVGVQHFWFSYSAFAQDGRWTPLE